MKRLSGTATALVAASVEECFELLRAVDAYPTWYPDTVREVTVLERDEEGRPRTARATLQVARGPLRRQIVFVLAVDAERPRAVSLRRLSHGPDDEEEFEVLWRLAAGGQTRIEVELRANLEIPRLVPLRGLGDDFAREFVAAAARRLGGPRS